ncbi:MAG: SprT protein [Verrucomicrobiota bacterium]|jgi:predicted SprT family Zn-dependent metalloprotease
MLSPKQLELVFKTTDYPLTPALSLRERGTTQPPGEGESDPIRRSEDVDLARRARELLRIHGAARIANEVRVEWNARLKSCAGRADYRHKLISLNPRLRDHPHEIERTFLHELAHLLAQFRGGRKRVPPHGPEWRGACRDLGIADEKRCHNLPFPIRERIRRFLYKCPNCARDFPRVKKIRRAIACLACCRTHNDGGFDSRFRLRLIA